MPMTPRGPLKPFLMKADNLKQAGLPLFLCSLPIWISANLLANGLGSDIAPSDPQVASLVDEHMALTGSDLLQVAVVAGLLGLIFWANTFFTENRKSRLNNIPEGIPEGRSNPFGWNELVACDSKFQLDVFYKKVELAYKNVTLALDGGDLGSVRRYLSNGVYRSLVLQYETATEPNGGSPLRVDITKSKVHRFEIFQNHVVAHVGIRATKVREGLDSTAKAQDVMEYWTFYRKIQLGEKYEMFESNQCPSCGSDLPDRLGDVCRCDYCLTDLNSGEFDWVLLEIIEADDYHFNGRVDGFEELVDEALRYEPARSLPQLEDMATSSYSQVLTTQRGHNPNLIRPYASPPLIEKFFGTQPNRHPDWKAVGLGQARLIGAESRQDMDYLVFKLGSVLEYPANPEDSRPDPIRLAQTEILIMGRKSSSQAKTSVGSVYAFTCPSCGTPISNHNISHCQSCGHHYNSASQDWVLVEILSPTEYLQYLERRSSSVPSRGLVDPLLSIKDYAFCNLLILMAMADGFVDFDEDKIQRLAKLWGYRLDRLTGTMSAAKARKLKLQMPGSTKGRRAVFDLMDKAGGSQEYFDESGQKIFEHLRAVSEVR